MQGQDPSAAEEEPAPEKIRPCRRSYSFVSRWSSDSGGWRPWLVYFFAARFLAPSAQTHCWRSGSSLLPELHIPPHMVVLGCGK